MKKSDISILWIIVGLVVLVVLVRNLSGKEYASQEAQAIPGIFFAQGGWAVCRRDEEYWTLHTMRHTRERWLRKLSVYERAGICTSTLEDDVVIIGPSPIPGTIQLAFQDRPDVPRFASFFAFFLSVYDVPDGLVWFEPGDFPEEHYDEP